MEKKDGKWRTILVVEIKDKSAARVVINSFTEGWGKEAETLEDRIMILTRGWNC